MESLEDLVFSQDAFQGAGIKIGVVGDLVDDVSEVGEEVPLVFVGEDGGHAGVVEFDGFVMNTDEVDLGMSCDKRGEGLGDDLGDRTLLTLLILAVTFNGEAKHTS